MYIGHAQYEALHETICSQVYKVQCSTHICFSFFTMKANDAGIEKTLPNTDQNVLSAFLV